MLGNLNEMIVRPLTEYGASRMTLRRIDPHPERDIISAVQLAYNKSRVSTRAAFEASEPEQSVKTDDEGEGQNQREVASDESGASTGAACEASEPEQSVKTEDKSNAKSNAKAN